MSPHSFQALQSSLQVLPVAMAFTTQLMLTQKSSAANNSDSPEQAEKSLMSRATRVTSILKSIQGYEHGGLNE